MTGSIAGEDEGARIVAERLRRQRLAMPELLGRADRVDAAEEAADPLEHLLILELGCASSPTRVSREPEAGKGLPV